jgi:ribosomal protein S18 acetylase RimI-like enzyme
MPARLRPADTSDSRVIAELFLVASDGLAAYIWSRIAEPGESLIAVGARRYARQNTEFSYQNCLLAEAAGQVVGMMLSFPLDPSQNASPESDPVLRPYSELEDAGSLYVGGLAVVPEYRRQGLGRLLMHAAESRAATMGRRRVSLICFEPNAPAMQLYRRLGYRERDRRALVPHPTLRYGAGDAVLLAKALASTRAA